MSLNRLAREKWIAVCNGFMETAGTLELLAALLFVPATAGGWALSAIYLGFGPRRGYLFSLWPSRRKEAS